MVSKEGKIDVPGRGLFSSQLNLVFSLQVSIDVEGNIMLQILVVAL